MAINKFNDILERTKRHSEERKTDRELKKKGIDKMNPDSWWADDGGEEKIDVPGFDATIQDLPEQDVNEKEIKVVPQEPKGTSFDVPSGQKDQYSLEQLAGNGMPEEEIPEPKEPKGTSFNLPKEENSEWDLEDLAGNGQREDIVSPQDDTVVEEPAEEESNVEEPEFTEDDVISEPEEDENSVSDEEVENTPAPEQPPSEEPPKEQPPADKTVADQKLESKKKAEEGQEEKPAPDEGNNKKEKEPAKKEGDDDEEPAPITKTEQGPVNDDTDLLKKGSGVSVSDMVDRSQIPHYDYLSFFR